jgi:hypothetical protein
MSFYQQTHRTSAQTSPAQTKWTINPEKTSGSKLFHTKIQASSPASSTLSILLNTRIFNDIKHKNTGFIMEKKNRTPDS